MKDKFENLRRLTLFICLFIYQSSQVFAQGSENFPTIGKIIRHDVRINALIPEDAKIEVLASGFAWSEGPLWVNSGGDGYLLFSDVPNNVVLKWTEGVGVSVFLKPSGYTGASAYSAEPGSNGLALDREGRLISCEHGDRRISRMEKNGGKKTLADSYMGKRFNSPNDLAIRSDGSIYFTDPPYGLPGQEKGAARELDFFGVFRVSPSGEVSLMTKEFTRPNGVAFSPDEKVFYVAQSDAGNAVIKAFPVKADGTLGQGQVFYDFTDMMSKLPGAPDGLKVDGKGNVFATGPGGVYVFTSGGVLLGRIDTGERTSNCAWGNDGSVLYMTADAYLCRIRTITRGATWQ